jgi:hypothetical protein
MASPAITTAFVEVPIPIGTAVRKINSAPSDNIRDGYLGRIRAVYEATPQLARDRQEHHGVPCAFGYDVVWDAAPGNYAHVLGIRLEVVVSAPGSELSGVTPLFFSEVDPKS